MQANLLYVLIGKAYAYANKTVYIDNDNFLAGQEATEYLIRRGHRRIAYLGSDNAYLFTADRKRGYQSALALAAEGGLLRGDDRAGYGGRCPARAD